jgi:hypothetical protein
VTSPINAGRRPSLERVVEGHEEPSSRFPLEPVVEQKGGIGNPGDSTDSPSSAATARATEPSRSSFAGLALPQLGGGADFGNEFWESTPLGGSNGKAPAVASPTAPGNGTQDASLQHQPSVGFRSMVQQAFDAPAIPSNQGSLHSQAGTLDSAPSRSNTTGTSDISPIMSRVPSSAATGARNAERREATPAIAEETESTAHNSLQTPIEGSHAFAENSSPAHSRNASGGGIPANFTPGYRRDLNTPSPNNSPARSPALEEKKQLPTPEAAQLAMGSPTEQAAAQDVFQPLNTSTREADIVSATDASPAVKATAAKLAQDAFIESSHERNVPPSTSKNIARSESPSKGRVADLANKFNETPDSRRGSVQSIASQKSSSSINKENLSRPTSTSGAKPLAISQPAAAERPIAERELSFRPKLPGQFESYGSSTADLPEQSSDKPVPTLQAKGTLSDVDFAPTTAKHQVDGKSAEPSTGPMAALAAAGVAMGAAIRKSMGSDEGQPHSPKSPSRAFGDVLHRPPPLDRLESTASTIPPTPPAKDEEPAPPVPFKDEEKGAEPVTIDTSNTSIPAKLSESSKDTTPTDFESDRLRREIVRSLSPEHEVSSGAAIVPEPLVNRAPNRQSTAIPSAYESYWASGGSDEKQVAPVEHSDHGLPEVASAASQPANEPILATDPSASKISSTSPGLLDRKFSWEKSETNSAGPASVISPISQSAPKSPSTLQPRSDPLSLNPKLSGEPLHIVNAEPGELPTPVEPTARRLSDEFTAPVAPEPHQPALQDFAPMNAPAHPAGPRPQSGQRPQSDVRPLTGDETRPANFREILAIKDTPARIAKYNETRVQFSKMPTGLDNWLSKSVSANPEYADISAAVHRPTLSGPTSTSPRHRATSSISRVFTKTDGSAGPAQSSARPATSEYGGKAGPATEQRATVVKGKDILKTAGVLGGKGMKEAKGLFAKGKSRFRSSGSEKVDD